jgi:hypothetical protein
MLSPAQIDINSLKADYEKNVLKGKLGIGAKSASVKTDNDFQRYNVNGVVEDLDMDRSNHFTYTEKINAGYVNYNRQFKEVMIQAGMRVENTLSQGVTSASKNIADNASFKRSYTDFFPSAAITLIRILKSNGA